jgi:hypothetical protein
VKLEESCDANKVSETRQGERTIGQRAGGVAECTVAVICWSDHKAGNQNGREKGKGRLSRREPQVFPGLTKVVCGTVRPCAGAMRQEPTSRPRDASPTRANELQSFIESKGLVNKWWGLPASCTSTKAGQLARS